MRERGASTIPLALLFPAVLVLVLLVVQAGLWWYARQAALTAAREGSEAARMFGSGPGRGAERARTVIDRIGTGVSDVRVSTAGSDGREVRITVSVRAMSLVPGVPGRHVVQRVVAPVERWTVPAALGQGPAVQALAQQSVPAAAGQGAAVPAALARRPVPAAVGMRPVPAAVGGAAAAETGGGRAAGAAGTTGAHTVRRLSRPDMPARRPDMPSRGPDVRPDVRPGGGSTVRGG